MILRHDIAVNWLQRQWLFVLKIECRFFVKIWCYNMSTRGVKFNFEAGEHVLCFEPDLSKARVLYGARVRREYRSLSGTLPRSPEPLSLVF